MIRTMFIMKKKGNDMDYTVTILILIIGQVIYDDDDDFNVQYDTIVIIILL